MKKGLIFISLSIIIFMFSIHIVHSDTLYLYNLSLYSSPENYYFRGCISNGFSTCPYSMDYFGITPMSIILSPRLLPDHNFLFVAMDGKKCKINNTLTGIYTSPDGSLVNNKLNLSLNPGYPSGMWNDTLTINVKDVNNNALYGVSIKIDSGINLISDAQGNARASICDGMHDVIVSKSGYRTASLKYAYPNKDWSNNLQIYMVPSSGGGGRMPYRVEASPLRNSQLSGIILLIAAVLLLALLLSHKKHKKSVTKKKKQ